MRGASAHKLLALQQTVGDELLGPDGDGGVGHGGNEASDEPAIPFEFETNKLLYGARGGCDGERIVRI